MHVPKIQEMLDKIPTPLSGAICNEKTGWLPPNFDDNCREILTETINELLESQPADFDPSALASTSKASTSQTVPQEQEQEQEWEYMVSWIESNRIEWIKNVILWSEMFLLSSFLDCTTLKEDEDIYDEDEHEQEQSFIDVDYEDDEMA